MRAFRIPTSASRVAVVKPHEYQSSLARCHSLTFRVLNLFRVAVQGKTSIRVVGDLGSRSRHGGRLRAQLEHLKYKFGTLRMQVCSGQVQVCRS